jgi:hypothetical protein
MAIVTINHIGEKRKSLLVAYPSLRVEEKEQKRRGILKSCLLLARKAMSTSRVYARRSLLATVLL